MAFPKIITRTFTAAVAVGLAISLGACGSGNADAVSSGESDSKVAPPTVMSAGELTVCTVVSPPNIVYDDNNELEGVEVGIAKAMAHELRLEPKFEVYDFPGMVPALQAQQCDVIIGSLYIKPEREKIVDFVPYLYSGTTVGVAKGNPKGITGIDDSLCGQKVVSTPGAAGSIAAEKQSSACEAGGKEPLSITLVKDPTASFQQVLAHQQDAYIDSTALMGYYAEVSDNAFEVVGQPVDQVRMGAATLKENPELHEALSGAFDTVVEDGRYREILEEWSSESDDITEQI